MVFRITRPAKDFTELFLELSKISKKIIIYEHTDKSRIHFHGLVKGITISVLAVKNRFAKISKFDKTDWSFKTKDITDNFITYMSKGNLSPCFNSGYTDEEVKAFTRSWTNKSVEEKVKSTDTQKATQKQIVDEVVQMLTKSQREDETAWLSPKLVNFALDNLISKLNEHKIIIGRYKIRDLLDSIFRQTHSQQFKDKMCSLYFERF